MRRAFTIIELFIVLVIVLLLTGLLAPVFQRARGQRGPAPALNCRVHLRQLGTALQIYSMDYDHQLPPHGYVAGTQSYTLPYLLHPYMKNGVIWQCSTASDAGDKNGSFDGTPSDTAVHYGYNWSALEQHGVGLKEASIRQPRETVTFAESTSYLVAPRPLIPVLGGTPPAYRHSKSAYVGWLDGSASLIPEAKLEATPAAEGGKPLGSGIDAYQYWNRR